MGATRPRQNCYLHQRDAKDTLLLRIPRQGYVILLIIILIERMVADSSLLCYVALTYGDTFSESLERTAVSFHYYVRYRLTAVLGNTNKKGKRGYRLTLN